jgi:hypothetical protein
MTESELLKTLDWLLALNIISASEYMDLYNKSLPFIE